MVRRRLPLNGREEALEIKRLRPASRELFLRRGPQLTRAVCSQLDPQPIGIGKIDRLVRTVVGRALNRRPRDAEAGRGTGQVLARGIQKRVVVDASMATGPCRRRFLGQHEHRCRPVAQAGDRRLEVVNPQAERGLIPRDRTVEVADRQADFAHLEGRRKRHRALLMGLNDGCHRPSSIVD